MGRMGTDACIDVTDMMGRMGTDACIDVTDTPSLYDHGNGITDMPLLPE
jgi:hypothetical protein